MKKPGEQLSADARRKIAEQERNAFIDGNAGLEGEGVTMMLGKSKKKQASAPAVKARMPITNMTERDEGAAFVIGLGGTTGEEQVQPEGAPSTTAPRTPREGGGKSNQK
jgi:hypothetical protein